MTKDELQHAWELARGNALELSRLAADMETVATRVRSAADFAEWQQRNAGAACLAPRNPDARAYVLTITLRVNGTVEVVPSREGHLVSLRRVCDSVADAENYSRILTAGLTEGRNDVSVIKVYL